MEFYDESEDLVVFLDTDRKRSWDEEYDILEDLITIEDEGIMDISHKLQQRDFDEYVSSLQKDTNILPQSFCRIKQNLKLLDRCRPLTIQVVDCKKFKIFYNNELAVDLKTRENFDNKFKEILSDKDNDISDDDTIELDVDIADDVDMDDLIKIDYAQEKHVDGLCLNQKINTNFEEVNQSESCDKEICMQSKSSNINIAKRVDDDNMKRLHCKSRCNNSSNVLKVCENFNCISISMQRDSSIHKSNKTIPHYHGRKDENIELLASQITNLPNANDDYFCKISQTKNVNLQNVDMLSLDSSFLIDTQRMPTPIDFINYNNNFTRKEDNKNKINISKTCKKNKNKVRPLDKSMCLAKKNKNKHTKALQLNIEMQKKIADMLVTVKDLKNTYTKKSSRKPSNYSGDAVALNNSKVSQTQVKNTNYMLNYVQGPQTIKCHKDNFTNKCHILNIENNNLILSDAMPAVYTDLHIQKQCNNNIEKAFMLSSNQYSCNSNLNCKLDNNNCNNFPDKNTEKGNMSKSISSINFMKPHLKKLAKANEKTKSIKIRPIHNYGLSNNMEQKESGKTFKFEKALGNTIQNNSISVNNSDQNNYKLNINKIIKVQDSSYESNLNISSVVVNKHPTVAKILQKPTISDTQQTTDANNVAVANINKNIEHKTVQGGKDDLFSCFLDKKEGQELQQGIHLFKNEVPQRIPTLQNRKIVETIQLYSKPDQPIVEKPNRESTIHDVTEPWRIPLKKKTDKETYEITEKGGKIELNTHKSSPKQRDKLLDTRKIAEESIVKEDVKKEIKPITEVEHTKPNVVNKMPETMQSRENTSIPTYLSPVQCVQIETNENSPKIVRKLIREEFKVEIKQKEIGVVNPIPSNLPEPNPLKSIVKNVEKSDKPNIVNSRTSAVLTKVTKKGYSPPVLPIPTFRKTFDLLARLNLISKYRYRRNRNIFKHEMVDQDKVLSNRSITKDLEKYFKKSNGPS